MRVKSDTIPKSSTCFTDIAYDRNIRACPNTVKVILNPLVFIPQVFVGVFSTSACLCFAQLHANHWDRTAAAGADPRFDLVPNDRDDLGLI